LTPKDLSSFDGIYAEKGSRSITSDGLKASSAKMLPPGSVLYTSRAPIGYVAIARNPIATNQGFKSFVLKEGYVPEYVFYLLKASKTEIESHASGGTFAEISAKAIADVLLPFPPLEHQQAIASLLSSLDLKLEINRSLSKTLEALAQALFESWFIDFDPVKGKLAGEASVGMDAETAALFPDSMEESERGEIPLGWELRSLAEVVSVTKGRSYKSSELEESSVSLVTLKSFFRGGGYREDGLKPFTGTFKDDQVVEPGELVMAFTDVTQAAELIGVPAIVQADPSADLLVASLDVGIVRPRSSSVPKPFVYFHLKSDSFRNHAKSHASGTTVLHLSKDAVPNFKVVMPPAELLQRFREVSEPVFSLIDKLSQESRLLSETRDSLLPRLISGELQIPDEMLAA
jgi:type I restriction enzyme S subunit